MMHQQGNLFLCTDEHNYQTIPADGEHRNSGYYKSDLDGNPIKGIVYRMVFCTKCGDNKEIIVVDRTTPKTEEKKTTRKITRRKAK